MGSSLTLLSSCSFSSWVLQKKGGVDTAPIALLAAGLIKQLEELDWKVSFDEPLTESFLA